MRSFVAPARSMRAGLVRNLAGKEVNRDEPAGLLRRTQTAGAASPGRKRLVLAARARERSATHLRSSRHRDRLVALPSAASARRLYQRSSRYDGDARERIAAGPDGLHHGPRVETLLSRPGPRRLLLRSI